MVNAQAERVFGYDRKEMLGQPIEMLVPGALSARIIRSCAARSSASPVSRPMGAGRDLYGLKKDGSEFPIEIGLNPIETDEGPMVLSAIVDISSRKRLEERFRQVVESAPNAMVMISDSGKIEMVNAQAERVFGYERKEMLGAADRDAGARALSRESSEAARLVLRGPGLASDGRGPRLVRPEERRQRVPDRDRPQPDRDGRGPDGALGHRGHHLAQALGGALPASRRVGAERDGHDQLHAARSRW